MSGVITPASLGSTTNRNVPDVSLNADPFAGYSFFVTNVTSGVQHWIYGEGGTGVSTTIWAAFAVLINDYRSKILNVGPMGFLNPAIYQLALSPDYGSTFHDIKDHYSTNGYYPAIPGYDLSTGWGSMIGSSLLYALGGCPSGFTFQNGYCVTSEPMCMPLDGLNRKQCQHRIKKCDRVGAKMKWNGTPCPEVVPGIHQKASGCHCDQYCGVKDYQCVWQAGQCQNKLGITVPSTGTCQMTLI